MDASEKNDDDQRCNSDSPLLERAKNQRNSLSTAVGVDNPIFTFENVTFWALTTPPTRPSTAHGEAPPIDVYDNHVSSDGTLMVAPPDGASSETASSTTRSLSAVRSTDSSTSNTLTVPNRFLGESIFV